MVAGPPSTVRSDRWPERCRPAKLLDSIVGYDPDDPVTGYASAIRRTAIRQRSIRRVEARARHSAREIGYAPGDRGLLTGEVFDGAVRSVSRRGDRRSVVIPDQRRCAKRARRGTMTHVRVFSRAARRRCHRADAMASPLFLKVTNSARSAGQRRVLRSSSSLTSGRAIP